MPNSDQLRSIRLNQCQTKQYLSNIYRHWSGLIRIDQNLSALISIDWLELIGIDRNWSALISIGHWSRESWIVKINAKHTACTVLNEIQFKCISLITDCSWTDSSNFYTTLQLFKLDVWCYIYTTLQYQCMWTEKTIHEVHKYNV